MGGRIEKGEVSFAGEFVGPQSRFIERKPAEAALFWLKTFVAHMHLDADGTHMKHNMPDGTFVSRNLSDDLRALEEALGFALAEDE